LGVEGADLGYAGIDDSEAVCLNLFNSGSFGSQFGFASDGEHPPTNTNTSPVDLHGGYFIRATVSYDGATLSVVLKDASAAARTFSASKTIDLPAAIGSDTAIVGFTAATGASVSTQDVLNWSFSGANDPTVATAASASPSSVTSGSTTTLGVLGSEPDGESGLTYTWSLTRKPPGAKDPTFSANGTNGAKSITATFFKDGTYRFRCTITNADGGSVISNVSVVVQQNATAIRLTPHKQQIQKGGTVDYNATVLDQFNHAMRTQPTITYSVLSGPGTINSSTGVFTASSTTKGHVVVEATAGDLSGTVGATVLA
jgi:hypothetical protein